MDCEHGESETSQQVEKNIDEDDDYDDDEDDDDDDDSDEDTAEELEEAKHKIAELTFHLHILEEKLLFSKLEANKAKTELEAIKDRQPSSLTNGHQPVTTPHPLGAGKQGEPPQNVTGENLDPRNKDRIIDELGTRVDTLEDELYFTKERVLPELHYQIRELEGELEAANAELREAKARENDNIAQWNKEETDEQKGRIFKLGERIKELEEELLAVSNKDATIDDLERKIVDLEKELGSILDSKLEKEKAEKNELERLLAVSIKSRKEDETKFKTEIVEEKNNVNSLQEKLEEEIREKTGLKLQMRELSAKLQNMEGIISDKDHAIENQGAKVKQLEEQLRDIAQESSNKECLEAEEIELKYKSEIENLNNVAKALEEKLEKEVMEKEENNKLVNAFQTKVTKLEEELSSKGECEEELIRMRENIYKFELEMKEKIEQFELKAREELGKDKLIEEKNVMLSSIKEKNDKLERELLEALEKTRENDRLTQLVAHLEEKLMTKNAECQQGTETQKRIQEMELEYHQYRSVTQEKLTVIEQKVSEKDTTITELNSIIKELEQEVLMEAGKVDAASNLGAKVQALEVALHDEQEKSKTAAKAELAWQMEKESQKKLIKELNTWARDLKSTLVEMEKEKERERSNSQRKVESLKADMEREQEETRNLINALQSSVSELADSNSLLKTKNDQLLSCANSRLEQTRSMCLSNFNKDADLRKIFADVTELCDRHTKQNETTVHDNLSESGSGEELRAVTVKVRESCAEFEKLYLCEDGGEVNDDVNLEDAPVTGGVVTVVGEAASRGRSDKRCSVMTDTSSYAESDDLRGGRAAKPPKIPLPVRSRRTGSESGYSSDTYNGVTVRRLERDTSIDRLSTASRESNTAAAAAPGKLRKNSGLFGSLRKLGRSLSVDRHQERDLETGSDISTASQTSRVSAVARVSTSAKKIMSRARSAVREGPSSSVNINNNNNNNNIDMSGNTSAQGNSDSNSVAKPPVDTPSGSTGARRKKTTSGPFGPIGNTNAAFFKYFDKYRPNLAGTKNSEAAGEEGEEGGLPTVSPPVYRRYAPPEPDM